MLQENKKISKNNVYTQILIYTNEQIGDKFVKMVPKTLMTDRVPTDIGQYIDQLEA